MSLDPKPAPEELVARLVDLARSTSLGDLSVREQAGLHDLERRLAAGARAPGAAPGRSTRIAVLLGIGVAAAAAATLSFRGRALTFEVVSGKVTEAGYVASGGADAHLRFSDHSDIDLDPETRVRVSQLDVRGAHVSLEGGTLHAHIQTQPRGRWTLDAGPYTVHVKGTEFDLAWRADEQTLDLRLTRGAVVVEGPLAAAGLQMVAGQHLAASVVAATLSLDEFDRSRAPGPAPAPTASAPSSVAIAAPHTPGSAISTPAPSPTSRGALVASRPRGEGPGWASRVARGDFDGVLADADRRGLERALAEGSASELAALADAARYSRRHDLAEQTLATERRRFPSSVQARDASFFLGGLAENDGSEEAALEWYDVYLRESPSGAYASQALGHEMMIVQRLRGSAEARPLALEYLARYPDGPYAPQARKLSEAQ